MSLFRHSRELPANPESVFAAFRDPARLARWWGPVHPVLMSRDVGASIRFSQRLGFSVTFQDRPVDPRCAGVARDGVEPHLRAPGVPLTFSVDAFSRRWTCGV